MSTGARDRVRIGDVIAAELVKLRTVRSTWWTLSGTVALGVGLAVLVSLEFRATIPDMPAEERARFDPLMVSFYGLTLAQLALVTFAVLVSAGEYGSGTVRPSLVAVPRRGVLYGAKLAAVLMPTTVVAAVTSGAAFLTAQRLLGPYGVSPSDTDAWWALGGACLYLVLICLFALGLAMVVRSSAAALGVLVPVLFLGSQGLGNVPKLGTVVQFLPDEAGMVVMHLLGPVDGPDYDRPYGPWGALGILVAWTLASLVGGYLTLRNRDT